VPEQRPWSIPAGASGQLKPGVRLHPNIKKWKGKLA
jgi:hypothetical protein